MAGLIGFMIYAAKVKISCKKEEGIINIYKKNRDEKCPSMLMTGSSGDT